MASIEYHLEELKIALDRNNEKRILPSILDSDKAILDIGCGVGQSFIALDCTDRACIGLDIDEDAVSYGIKNFGSRIHYILSDAKRIPLPSNTFNLVYSRVALPYTNIPKAIREIRRVLRNDGRVWMTLHSREMIRDDLKKAISARNIKRLIHVVYIMVNGYLLKHFGVLVPFINGRFESWQDASTMKNLLIRNGFQVDVHEDGRHTVIQGSLA